MALVESGRVCWAVAEGMERRLSDLLRHQRRPPLDRDELEGILRACRTSGTPLGEALLSRGRITEQGLRSALFRQATEAIAHIAILSNGGAEFIPHGGARYDARFPFSPVEIYAALGARKDRATAAAATRELESIVPEGAVAFAFDVDESQQVGAVMTVIGDPAFRVAELLDACTWARSLFELASAVDPSIAIATGRWRDGGRSLGLGTSQASLVTWRSMGLLFCSLCSTQGAYAVLTGRLANAQHGGSP